MRTVESISELREAVRAWRKQGLSVAFVPTMGNLHDGHIRLVEEAKRQGDRAVVSIFVNPTQFGPNEDFAAYPRTPEQDAEKLRVAGTDLLFLPGTAELYPQDAAAMTFIEVPGLSGELCGQFRPGHFRGVATVVCKLLNQVQPDVALFGEKDYQQLTIIRRMVADLDLPVRIQGVPTVREPSGLAMSSRNAYLSGEEKSQAALLLTCLREAAEEIHRGGRDYERIEREKSETLSAHGFQADYFAIRRQEDLGPPGENDEPLVILVAARLGRTRLIDNLLVTF
jgi:pantoate--beta-alanine ligase